MLRISATCASSGQPWMTAREHHPQLLVADRGAANASSTTGAMRPLDFEQAADLGRERPRRAFAAHDVEGAVASPSAISQADGLSGTPRTFHTSSARQKASCTTSSASARLWTPKMRVSAATSRPDSRRKRCSLELHAI